MQANGFPDRYIREPELRFEKVTVPTHWYKQLILENSPTRAIPATLSRRSVVDCIVKAIITLQVFVFSC